ncbi:MAG: DUF4292 domain-containing protein [Balneolaceae bacterium]|nr:DUF4292 domain-containing protein [Balneolaceae bacterium]
MASALMLFSACRTAKPIENTGFSRSDINASELLSQIPDYTNTLHTLKGKGKAIVSEPGNTERVTIYFSSSRAKSHITVKNGVGIEGGQMLTDGDTLLVYNKIDNYARKISIKEGNLSKINNLASLNILDMINFSIKGESIKDVLENENHYLLNLDSGAKVYLNKEKTMIREVRQPKTSKLPYSKIMYDGYSTINGYELPRRITIISADETSKVAFLVQSLETNPPLEELSIEIPGDATVYNQ